MQDRLDDIDRRILYYLRVDARNTTAPMIAQEVDVSAATIRNRIDQLEDRGIIQGYHAEIDYEVAEGKLMNVFLCNAPTGIDDIVPRVLQVPGVVHVRSTMTGRENLHVQAIGTDTGDLTRIKRELVDLGLGIEDEGLVNGEYYRPYDQYGPADTHEQSPLTDLMSLAGGAEVIEITVNEAAPIAGRTIERFDERDRVEVHTVESDSVADALIDVATDVGGPLLVGASRNRVFRRSVFGSNADRVVARSASVGSRR